MTRWITLLSKDISADSCVGSAGTARVPAFKSVKRFAWQLPCHNAQHYMLQLRAHTAHITNFQDSCMIRQNLFHLRMIDSAEDELTNKKGVQEILDAHFATWLALICVE
ncbi:hypothetical protein [Massilia sp. LC238]|uniref:hypothetical protein n=1 Tax=Massilia sp. LC238 TaxID=1502852 RepID=UPI001269D2C5|nr:hypothetical protein [Massilia sp. LC238]